MPGGAIYVGRPSKWGNPFTIAFCMSWFGLSVPKAREQSIELFRQWLSDELAPGWTNKIPPPLAELRGKDLACWCNLSDSCHADILLEIANQ